MTILARWNDRQLPLSKIAAFPNGRLVEDFFDEFFSDWNRLGTFAKPASTKLQAFGVDLKDGKDAVTILADLPGFKKEDVTIEFEDQRLIIRAERKHEISDDDEKKSWYVERQFGRFERVIPISADVLTEKASATFTDGVLKVLLPKAPESLQSVRQIKISDGH